MASFIDLIWGRKPEVAEYRPVDLSEEQQKSLIGNIQNFGAIGQLGDLYRQYYLDQTEAQLPRYAATLAEGQKGAFDIVSKGREYLTGEIPKDVQEKIQRSSAYKSFSGGYAGSGMARGLTARDLGLTSLDLIGRGAQMVGLGGNSAQQWASLARGNTLNPSVGLTTPQQQAELELQNRVLQQQSQQFAYNVAAAPDPAARGIHDSVMGLIGMYMGGMGGGGMGGGGGGGVVQPQTNWASYQPQGIATNPFGSSSMYGLYGY